MKKPPEKNIQIFHGAKHVPDFWARGKTTRKRQRCNNQRG